ERLKGRPEAKCGFTTDGDGQCRNLRQNRKTASTVSNVRCRWRSAARRRYCRQRSNGSWSIAYARPACTSEGRRPQPVSAELAAAYERATDRDQRRSLARRAAALRDLGPWQTAISDVRRVGAQSRPLTMSAFLVRRVTIY